MSMPNLLYWLVVCFLLFVCRGSESSQPVANEQAEAIPTNLLSLTTLLYGVSISNLASSNGGNSVIGLAYQSLILSIDAGVT